MTAQTPVHPSYGPYRRAGNRRLGHAGPMTAAYLHQLDPMLPTEFTDPAGVRLEVVGGYGIATTQRADPAALSSTWTDDLQHVLLPRVTTPDAMDALLSAWLDHLPAGERGMTKLAWPSHGTEMATVLHQHGFRATGVLAIRPAGRQALPSPPDSGIRPVTPDDVDVISRLWLELVDWDAQFGNLLRRSGTRELVRRATEEYCSVERPLSMVVEQNGAVVSAMLLNPADEAAWVQGMTGVAPAAYLAVGLTTRAARGRGIGEALARSVAAGADEHHAATLLN